MAVPLDPSEALGDEYSLIDYLLIIRRRWVWFVVPLLAALALAYSYTATRPARYAASAQVLLADSAAQRTLDPSSQNPWFLSRELSNEILLAQSDQVKDKVEAELGFAPTVTITDEEEADLLSFNASANDPERAADSANTWARVYVSVKQDEAVDSIVVASARMQERLEEIRIQRQEVRSPLDELQDQMAGRTDPQEIAVLQAQYNRLSNDLSYELDLLTAQSEAVVSNLSDLELQAELASVGEARIVQVAAPPANQANAPASRNLTLGLVVGAIAGIALALLVDLSDSRIRSVADLRHLGVPVLGSIPKASRRMGPILDVIAVEDPSNPAANGYQKLQSAVDFMISSGDLRSLLITSANSSEGKSTTASNLALALSDVGRPTSLVDADFRKGRIHEIYSLNQSPGLSDFVLGERGLHQIGRNVAGSSGLVVIPTGLKPPNPAAFVGADAFRAAVEAMTTTGFIVIDSAPVLAVSDTTSIARQVDGVLLTAWAGRTKGADLERALSGLDQMGARVLGVVLVGADDSSANRGNRYRRTDETSMFAGRQRLPENNVENPVVGGGAIPEPALAADHRSAEATPGVPVMRREVSLSRPVDPSVEPATAFPPKPPSSDVGFPVEDRAADGPPSLDDVLSDILDDNSSALSVPDNEPTDERSVDNHPPDDAGSSQESSTVGLSSVFPEVVDE